MLRTRATLECLVRGFEFDEVEPVLGRALNRGSDAEESLSVLELLERLRALDIRLWEEDGSVCCSAPEGALGEDLREEIRARRSELLEVLTVGSREVDQEMCRARAHDDGSFRLSFAQERIWFLEKFVPGTAAWNFVAALDFEGSLDHSLLEAALQEVIRRHDSLRTRISERGDEPRQWRESQVCRLRLVEILDGDGSAFLNEEARRVIDPVDFPMRASLLRLSAQRHVLVLVLHHLVCDGISKEILFRELIELYVSRSVGREPRLEEPRWSYADYAETQRQWLETDTGRESLESWRRELRDPPIVELHSPFARPPVVSMRGDVRSSVLPEEVVASVRAFATKSKHTLFAVVLAAFFGVLRRFTQQEDLIVGVASAGRDWKNSDRTVGLFVNTLPIRARVSRKERFCDLVGSVASTLSNAQENGRVPFDRIVAAVSPSQRDLSRPPLVQILVSFMAVRPLPKIGQDLRVRRLRVGTGTSKLDLSLEMEDDGRSVRMWLEHNTDIFDSVFVDRLAGQFAVVLEDAMRDPEQYVGVLGTAHAREGFAGGPVRPMRAARAGVREVAHRRFEQMAREQPNAIAVETPKSCVSYRSLNEQANRLSRRLVALGVGLDDRVIVYSGRTPGLVVALLAVWKAGGAYVPLEVPYPSERFAEVVQDSGARVVLAAPRLAPELPESVKVVALDQEIAENSSASGGNPKVAVGERNLAYVIYTSGTSGKPKGVMIEHGSLSGLLSSMDPMLASDPVVWLSATTITFDISVLELFWPLTRGQKLVLDSGTEELRLPPTDRRKLDWIETPHEV